MRNHTTGATFGGARTIGLSAFAHHDHRLVVKQWENSEIGHRTSGDGLKLEQLEVSNQGWNTVNTVEVRIRGTLGDIDPLNKVPFRCVEPGTLKPYSL